MKWNELSNDEKQSYIDKLQEACDGLIIHHSDYKNFKTVKVICPASDKKADQNLCLIRWNGHRLDEVTGWGLLEREIPAQDIPIVARRYIDKLKHWQNGDKEG
jgi:hypothetical protein